MTVEVSEWGDLLARWSRRWSPSPCHANQLKHEHSDRWVRFHSLPESKRYPSDEADTAIVLDRHYTLLEELFGETEILVITASWSDSAEPPPRSERDVRINPNGRLQASIPLE